MHISDGILPAAVTLSAWGVTGAVTSVVIARIREDEIPRTAVLTSLFLVASYISIPLGFGSVHLLLTGLMGILLGWAAFPAIFVALFIQLLWFGYGGFYTLGINTLNLAIGALAAHVVFIGGSRIFLGESRAFLGKSGVFLGGSRVFGAGETPPGRDGRGDHRRATCLGFASGGIGIVVAALCYFVSLRLAGNRFHEAAKYAFIAHLPVLIIETLVTGVVVSFLARVRPSILQRRRHDRPS